MLVDYLLSINLVSINLVSINLVSINLVLINLVVPFSSELRLLRENAEAARTGTGI